MVLMQMKKKKVILPGDIKERDTLNLKNIDPKQHFTQPPPKYTEATLVKELEKEGIGRPSTYAAILNTVKARNYVTAEKIGLHQQNLVWPLLNYW